MPDIIGTMRKTTGAADAFAYKWVVRISLYWVGGNEAKVLLDANADRENAFKKITVSPA